MLDEGNQALDGLYVGANFHYLHGFGYEHFVPAARLDTDAQGLLIRIPPWVFPSLLPDVVGQRHGAWLWDAGAAVIVGRWEIGLGVNGIGNRINWTGLERTQYVLDSLFSGGEFNDLPAVPVDDLTVELPVDVRGNASYDAGPWMAITEIGHGYNGTSVRVGYEQRLDRIQLRGGAATSRNAGSRRAALASTCPTASASTLAFSARVPISNVGGAWPSRCRCASWCRNCRESARHGAPARCFDTASVSAIASAARSALDPSAAAGVIIAFVNGSGRDAWRA